MDEFLQDLDEDVEGMQSTIYFLQNELQKCKTSVQNTNNSENKETTPKVVVNGIKKDDISNSDTPQVSKTEIPNELVTKKPDNRSSKHNKSKDSKHSKDSKSNLLKVKKSRPVILEATDQSGNNLKVHKSKHKSEGSKSGEKRIKSEKRTHKKDEVVPKKLKSDRPKSTEVKPPVEVINGLSNGS